LKFEAVNDEISKYIGSIDGTTVRGFTRKKSKNELLFELSQQHLDLIGYQLVEDDA